MPKQFKLYFFIINKAALFFLEQAGTIIELILEIQRRCEMDLQFQHTNSDLHQLHLYLRQLEQATNENNAQPILQEIYRKLTEIKDKLNSLNHLINKEPAERKRILKYRYDQLKYDCDAVESSINSLQSRLTLKWQSAAEREELLTRRFKPNETHLNVDDSELLMHDHLKQSHSAVDDLISQGTAVLNSLKTQDISLRGIKTKVLSIGQTLGLSTTTLRLIEKRLEEDWIIFLVLALFFLIFMFCFYRYWKS